jgi:hypothetical protein
METTKNIQQLLFRTIDSLEPGAFAEANLVRELLIAAAREHTPFLYDALCRHIESLVAEYCGS